jgi:hypothetical protein
VNLFLRDSLAQLFGLSPGTECEFRVCVSPASGFGPEATWPTLVKGGLTTAETIGLRLLGIFAILLQETGDAAPCVHEPGGCGNKNGGGEWCHLQHWTDIPGEPGARVCHYLCEKSLTEIEDKIVGVCEDDVWVEDLAQSEFSNRRHPHDNDENGLAASRLNLEN